MPQEAAVPGENIQKRIEEIQGLIKETFDNPDAFIMLALCVPRDNVPSTCKVRFLSQGNVDPKTAYIGAMLACHELAKQKMEWPDGEGPMATFSKAPTQDPPWGKG